MPPEIDGEPRHTSGLTAALAMVGVVIGLALLPVEGAIMSGSGGGEVDEPGFMGWLFPLFMILGAGREVASWYARTYRLTDDRLVIDEGILTRHNRVVPFERVQQIDISRSLGQQIFGLAALSISTAGEAGTTKVDLRFLDRRRALGIRSYVLRRREELKAARRSPPGGTAAETSPGDDGVGGTPGPSIADGSWAPDPPEEIAAVGPGRLAVAVLTRSWALIGLATLLVGVVTAWTLSLRSGDGPSVTTLGTSTTAVAVLVVFAGAMQAVSQIVAMWGLRVEATGEDLHMHHGLFDVRHVTIPRSRVQVIRVEDNPLQRLFGFASVTLRSASSPHVGTAGGPTVFRIPHVPRADVDRTVRRLLGPLSDGAPGRFDEPLPQLRPRGSAAERRSSMRGAAAGVLACVAWLLTGPAGMLVVVVGAACGYLWGMAAHSRAGWMADHEMVLLARGVLSHRLDIVPLARVQSASTRSNPFQRRVGLTVLRIDVAGGSRRSLWDLEDEVADTLRDELPRASGP